MATGSGRHSPAVVEIRESIEDWQDRQRSRLVTFALVDALITLASAGFVVAVWALVSREVFLLAAAGLVGLASVLMARSAVVARSGDLSRAVGWLSAGNLVAISAGVLVAPPVWPVMVLASLVPAVVAASYVRADEFRGYLIGSTVAATVSVVGGIYVDLTGAVAETPAWVIDMLHLVFVPTLVGVLGYLTLQNFARVRAMVVSLSDAHAGARILANDALSARSRMMAAADRERRRIERDLHDGTQQHFAALGLRLGALRRELPADADDLVSEVDGLRADVKAAQTDLRDLIAAIYPPTLAHHGLTSAIRLVADRHRGRVITDIAEVGRCETTIETAVYFTMMEALQNAAKHAGEDTVVTVRLARSEDHVRFTVSDDGVGFDSVAGLGDGGLVNMSDRIVSVLGTLEIDSTPGVGTTVQGAIPVRSTRTSR